MEKINLLHILPTLQIGGAEKQVVTLLKHIDKNKYQVSLCCFHSGGSLVEDINKNDNIDIIYLGFRLRHFFVSLIKLIFIMKKKNIHIVHTHLYTDHFWGRIAAVLAGVPVIITTEHGRGLWKKKRHLLFERIANKFTDMRIAVSEDIRQIRINKECTPPEKVITIMNSINPEDFIVTDDVRLLRRKEFGLNGEEAVLGTVARFDPDKALDLLLDAMSRISKKIKRVKLLLVGDGYLRKDLEEHARKIGIAEKVIFAGIRTDIADLLSIMDVYVNSSHREGVPVSLLEAMAAGKAVVATDVGGNSEVINDSSVGMLVPANRAEVLAESIISLLDDVERRMRMGSNARERIENNFSIKIQSKKIESLYEELLEKKRIGISQI